MHHGALPDLPGREIPVDDRPELRLLFHRLNNQLGVVLAHAELLEAKLTDEAQRSRAGHVVGGVLEALGTTKEIRTRLQVSPGTIA
jgi:hypothetical protein